MSEVLFVFILIVLIYPISFIPFSVLYLLSDFFYLLLFKIFKYRVGVTKSNLRNSFPEKEDKEITQITRAYYHFLCDVFLETFKLLSISKNKLSQRVQFSERFISLFDDYRKLNTPVIAVMGHLGNWEWAGASFSLQISNKLYALYHPLSNKIFDRLMLKIRTRFGGKMIPMNQLPRFLSQIKNTPSVLCFIADQTPPPEHAHWIQFLNQDTPFFKGPASVAKKMNWPIIFVSVKTTRKGNYYIDAELISDSNSDSAETITQMWAAKLESKILEQPSNWLWSHKRWKHKREKWG